jgi:hypothetical protein
MISGESKMIGRLIFVLLLSGALVIAASWNSGGGGSASKFGRQSSRPDQLIRMLTIDPDRAPPAPAPPPPASHSSQQRMIAQN